ncbi:MAG TPA: methyltransferase domain-containing protein [Gemmatimonadaceae bacterium]
MGTVMTPDPQAPHTKGRVMRSEARYYDLLAWLFTLGRERAFRERLVELARLAPGEAVVDVGCGTGTLAIAAKRCVGATGIVHGIDASPEMIELAKRKAGGQGVEVAFQTAVVEALPFPDASFDVVLSTLMLHHLPRAVREQCAREMRRVLKPGGRVLAVDFATPAQERRGLLGRFHKHGSMALDDMVQLLRGAELRVAETGAVGVSDLQFVVAMSPSPGDVSQATDVPPVHRSLAPLPMPRWIVPVLIGAVLAAHGLIVSAATSRLALSVVALVGVVALLVLMHAGPVSVLHGMLRRLLRR